MTNACWGQSAPRATLVEPYRLPAAVTFDIDAALQEQYG
jgi:hypothetical protein